MCGRCERTGELGTRQLAVAHVDPDRVTFAREIGRRYPPDPAATTGVPNVIRTGRSELYPDIPRELLEGRAVDAEHLRLIRELELRSAMIVPLRGREHVFGALTFVYAESGRRYSQPDLEFAEELARRASAVIERRKLEEERESLLERERDARTQAELASRAKDEFLAIVSHELRNPLSAILGWTRLLIQRQLPPEVAKPLATIERNARAQARLIEDVLDVSRIISGKLRLDLAEASIVHAVTDAAETVRPTAEAKSIELTTAWTPISAACGSSAAAADHRQSAVERREVHAGPRSRFPGGEAGWLTLADRGQRQRQRHRSEAAVRDLPALPAGRCQHHAPSRWPRSRPRHRGTPGRGARRKRLRRERGTWHGRHVHRRIARSLWHSTPPVLPSDAPAAPRSLLGRRVLVVDDEPDVLEVLRATFVGLVRS